MRNANGKIALGYLSGRNGYYINSLYKNKDKFIFTIASEQHNSSELAWESFKNGARAFGTKFVCISTNELDQHDWVFGSYRGNIILRRVNNVSLDL